MTRGDLPVYDPVEARCRSGDRWCRWLRTRAGLRCAQCGRAPEPAQVIDGLQGRTPKRNGGTRTRRRNQLLRRDGPTCAYCGRALDPAAGRGIPGEITMDHVVPRRYGGSHDLRNLVLACRPCNEEKDA